MDSLVFFLPINGRPKGLPPLPADMGKFWHAGIIHNDKVYECFNHGKFTISPWDEPKKSRLENAEAVFIPIPVDVDKLKREITSGTSCGEYVARVVGLSPNHGDIKRFTPQEAYDFLSHQQAP